MNQTMHLTGLNPDNPIAWMAAAGTLRLLAGARMRWNGSTPELDYAGDPIAALAALPEQRRRSPEYGYPHKLGADMDAAAWEDLKRLPGEWALALGAQSEGGMRATALKIRPGDYDMMSDARKVLNDLCACDLGDKVQEALLGPWRYEDRDIVAWGWDAAARVDAAAISCKAEKAPRFGVLGAYWLGWEALPLFPVIGSETRGWSDGLRYPTWTEWLDYQDLKALMLGLDRLRRAKREALGIRVWFARYLRTHPSSGRLGWASEVARTPSAGKNPGGSRTAQVLGFMIL